MPKARVRLTLIESTRRTTLRAVGAELFGMSTYAALIAVSIFGARAMHRMAPTSPIDEAVRFFAPLRQSAPPPMQESVQFIGLGGLQSVSIPVSEPSPRGNVPAPRGSAGDVASELIDLPSPPNDSEKAYSEIEVDSTVTLDPSAEGPQYPPALLQAGVQGVVYARFIVDTVGHVDTATLVVLDKPDPEFVNAVRTALVRMKYRPAVLRGRAVAQLVEQPFVFRIQPPGVVER